jgi:hypothetical protein
LASPSGKIVPFAPRRSPKPSFFPRGGNFLGLGAAASSRGTFFPAGGKRPVAPPWPAS